MKLVSFNISIKLDNNDSVVEFLRGVGADIIALQESIRHFDGGVFERYRSAGAVERSLAATHPHRFFAPSWWADKFINNGKIHRDFGGKVEQGNHIISKFPIAQASNLFFQGEYGEWSDVSKFRELDHPRNVALTTIKLGSGTLKTLNLHGIWNENKLGDARHIHQSEFIINEALKDDLPTIIMGDFNLLPESEGIGLMNKRFRNLINEYGIKSTRPVFDDGLDQGGMVVDYIFTNDKVKVNNFEVGDTDISDHRPLILDFSI